MSIAGCRRCRIRGRVQGVWFRASTKEQADALGLTGWVRNLPGGEVEVHACGPEADLDRLRRWLHRGPPMALVEAVSCRPVPTDPSLHGFEVR
jgi:acylphosphatase